MYLEDQWVNLYVNTYIPVSIHIEDLRDVMNKLYCTFGICNVSTFFTRQQEQHTQKRQKTCMEIGNETICVC